MRKHVFGVSDQVRHKPGFTATESPLGAWDGLRYFNVALPEPSINYFTATEDG